MTEPEIFSLPNGIRVAYKRVTSSKIVHCGIMFNIGSRDENRTNQGIAHFWEHMAFKGTRKRNAFQILNRLETVGGELNAFTDKEKIMFYASVRSEHAERAAELLSDIAFHSIFPENHIKRERRVIQEEMAMYYDDPDGALQDEFDQLIFHRHPMGMNILGTEKTISAFSRTDFKTFILKNFDTREVVFSITGDLTMSQVQTIAKKSLEPVKRQISRRKRTVFEDYTPKKVTIRRPVKQARCALGRPSFSIRDDRRVLLYFLNNILGGPGMNSRLNLSLREKHGYVYSVGSQYIPFSDTGLFVISFGTEPGQIKKTIALAKDELRRLVDRPLSQRQLSISREQFFGQLAMAEENHIGFMMMMARNVLDSGVVMSFDHILERIRAVTPKELQVVASESFGLSTLSTLIMEPDPLVA
ncbi:MAG: insulinase family protein [Bacteroidetes bacterium]|nr:insulinase family protein [Bacteroidota bacterium]